MSQHLKVTIPEICKKPIAEKRLQIVGNHSHNAKLACGAPEYISIPCWQRIVDEGVRIVYDYENLLKTFLHRRAAEVAAEEKENIAPLADVEEDVEVEVEVVNKVTGLQEKPIKREAGPVDDEGLDPFQLDPNSEAGEAVVRKRKMNVAKLEKAGWLATVETEGGKKRARKSLVEQKHVVLSTRRMRLPRIKQ